MSKRLRAKINPVQSLAHKKPKLNVTVTASTSKCNDGKILPPPTPSNSKAVTENTCTTNNKLENDISFNWNDDDDDDDVDFLLAASQMVEDKAKSEKEFSFINNPFKGVKNLPTSTQKNNDAEKPFTIPKAIFDNDSVEIEFEPTLMEASESICNNAQYTESQNHQKVHTNKKKEDILFNINKEPNSIPTSEMVRKLTSLEKATNNQKIIIDDQSERIQNKEGEISVLRFEIKQLKTQVDALKTEKMKEAENIKKNWVDQIAEWERKYNAAQLELNIKSNEVMKLKQNFPESKTQEIKKCSKQFSSLNLLHIDEFIFQNNEIKLNSETFCNTVTKYDTFIDQFAEREIDILYNCLTTLQKNSSIYNNNLFAKIKQTLERTFAKLSIYFESLRQLEFTKNNQITPLKLPNKKGNQIQQINVNPNKRFQAIRKYIIIFGLICEKIPKISELLNLPIIRCSNFRELNHTPINVMNRSIDLNSFGFESSIFESYALLFNCLGKTNKVNSENISLLKALLFKHRPSLRTLLYITESLFHIAKNSKETLNLLCDYVNPCHYNLEKKILYIYQKPSGCVLQIYCNIFELTMNNEELYNTEDTNLIIALWEKYLLFLRYCLTNPPHFIFKSNDLINKKCNCFYKLSKAFVNFFYANINRLNNNTIKMPDCMKYKLYELGSLLVYDFYHHKSDIHNMTFLSLKHKLYIICEWLDNCREFFKLKDSAFEIAINYVRTSIFVNSMENININSEKGFDIMKSAFKLI